MPIRTDRGRSAIYRKIWGWPLRSPQRLMLTALLAVGVGIGIALLASLAPVEPQPGAEPATSAARPIPHTGQHTAPRQPGLPTPSPTGPASATATTVLTTPTAEAGAASPDPVQTARAFAARWVTHPPGMTGPQWAAQLAPLVVPEYLSVLESVEPSSIPATAVNGDPMVTSRTAAVVEATVPTNAGGLQLVLLAQPDSTWRVRSHDRAAS